MEKFGLNKFSLDPKKYIKFEIYQNIFGNYFARRIENQMHLYRSSDIVEVDDHNGVKSYL